MKLRSLLDNLLGLQKLVLLKNKETHSIVGGASKGSHSNGEDNSNEEIPSDSEDEQATRNGTIGSESGSKDEEISTVAVKRKRKRPDWVMVVKYILILAYIHAHVRKQGAPTQN